MKALLTDPVVLICIGIIIAGVVGLFWAIGRFRRLGPSPEPVEIKTSEDLFASNPDLRDIDFRAPALTPAPAPNLTAPAVGRDVADRLESMTQRLAEMQSVLMKQSSVAGAGAPATGAAGSVGQGFSPETIDKLLKIIGNVVQQVEVLQKNLNVPKENGAAKAESTASPFAKL